MAADGFFLSKSDLLSVPADSESAATIGGRAINAVHEVFSSSAAFNAEQRKMRAQHGDQLAEVVADSVAMLPGLRAPIAGLLRATTLADVSTDLSGFASKFAVDFIEGAALNKMSSTLMPEGAIGKRISSQMGGGIAAETLSIASAGGGMASLTTAFHSETWLDQDKNFSVLQGGENILKAAAFGAVISAPSGLLANRISRIGLALGAEGRISPSSALAISGLGAGYFSGTAVGAAQGLMAGGDFKTVLNSMNEGGIAGALSGAVGLAALGKIPTARFQVERTADIHESTIASSVNAKIIQQELATNSRGDSVIAEKGQLQTSRGEQKSGLEFFRSLEIKAEKLDLSEATLRDRVRRLGEPVPGVLRYYVAVENGAEMAARSKDFNEFVRNGGMRNVQDTVRHYAVGSGQTITISESYAAKLDEVLALRLKASEPLDPYLYGVGHAHEVAKARVDLKAHPWANMAHPADFVSLLEELPDRTLVKDLFIRHDRSPGDAWTAKEFSSPDFKAAATASQQESRIAFYGQERSELMRYYLKHEWGHLLKWAANTESTRFDQAAILEKDGYYVSDYSKRNNDENWAEHAANLLDPDTDHFVETAHGAPLRTVEIGRALLKSLVAVPHGIAGTHQAEVSARINYIQERIIPAAQDKLISIIKTGNEETAPIAARLLSRIAGREQLDALADLAKTHTSPVIRKAAFAAGWEASEKGVVTLSGYNDIAKAPSDSVMRDFLLSHAEPDSLSRDVAIQKLGQMQDNSSRFHYDMLTLDQHPSTERLKRSLILMDAAPDTEGLKQAFAEALKSVEGNPNERVNLALRALDRFPRLVADSVDILATEAQPRTRPFLRDLTNHYNEKIARLAAEGLRKVDLQQRLEDLGKSIQSASATERMNAVESLAALRSSKAAAVLVDSYISSSNDVERAGISSAMRRYISPEIWKFEVRRQKQQNPSLNAVLDKLMNPRG